MEKRKILSIINLIAFIFTLPGVIALPFAILGGKENVIHIYNEASIPIPPIVKLFHSIHPLIFVLFVLCFIAKEFSKRKLAILVTNIVIFFLGAFSYFLYHSAIFYVIYSLPLKQ